MMFIDKINNQISGLSKVQTKIAKFLITNPDKACFLSLKEPSSEIGTAEVTIMNFSKKIGYDNYMQLKKGYSSDVTTTKKCKIILLH
ncbi:MAG: hypothetical protein LR001_08455, partial [Clostridiales bacterium]|nr:hypothetical protein [Clostridiales bacterium]